MSAPPHRNDIKDLALLACMLGVYFGILVLTTTWRSSGGLWAQLLAPSLWLLLSGAAFARDRARGFSLTRGGRHAGAMAALAAASALMPILVAAAWPSGAFTGVDRLCQGLLLIILIPPAEEFYFRGLLLDHVRRTSGTAAAVIMVSLLFGLLHFPQGTIVATAALSVLLCIVTIASRSLIWPTALHAAWNGTALVEATAQGATRWVAAGFTIAVVGALILRGVTARGEG